MHREIYGNSCPTRCNYIQFIHICKPLYMFRVVSPPIIRCSCRCIHSIHLTLVKPYLQRDWTGTAVPVQSRSQQIAVTGLLMPHAVDTGIWALYNWWRYHPKHVERITDINKLYIVAFCWTIIGMFIWCLTFHIVIIADMQQVWINEYNIKSYGLTYWLVINWFLNKSKSKLFRLMCLYFLTFIASLLNSHWT